MGTQKNEIENWSNKSIKEATFLFIEDFKNSYANEYRSESNRYEQLYYNTNVLIIILGIIVSILAVFDKEDYFDTIWKEIISISLVVIPIISSSILAMSIQFGYKDKFSLRETARIEASFYYREARVRYYLCKKDEEYAELYRWLNGVIKIIQDEQKGGYMDTIQEIKK